MPMPFFADPNNVAMIVAIVYFGIAAIFLISDIIIRMILLLLLESDKSSLSFFDFLFSVVIVPVIAAIYWPAIVFVYFVCLIGNDWNIDFSFDLERWKWIEKYFRKQ